MPANTTLHDNPGQRVSKQLEKLRCSLAERLRRFLCVVSSRTSTWLMRASILLCHRGARCLSHCYPRDLSPDVGIGRGGGGVGEGPCRRWKCSKSLSRVRKIIGQRRRLLLSYVSLTTGGLAAHSVMRVQLCSSLPPGTHACQSATARTLAPLYFHLVSHTSTQHPSM